MANIQRRVSPSRGMLPPAERQLLRDYYAVCARLREAKIVRSGNVSGDIGEWLVVQAYGLELEDSCRNRGFEGFIEHQGTRYRTQVKVHNASDGWNLNVGNPDLYDVLLVLVGPNSFLRDPLVTEGGRHAFHVYIFDPSTIRRTMNSAPKGTYSCAKKVLHADAPDNIIPF